MKSNGYRIPRRWLTQASLLLMALTLWCVAITPARAQTFDATNLQKPSNIDAKWRVKEGNDLAWSRPEFDDSDWMLVDPNRNLLEYFPREQPEILWYRIRVTVAPKQPELAIETDHLSHAYEVFVDGQRVIAVGTVSPYKPYSYFAYTHAAIPKQFEDDELLVIAIRVHISRGEWFSATPGLYYDNLLFGRLGSVLDHLTLRLITTYAGSCMAGLLALLVGILAMALFSTQQTRTEYLWIAFTALAYVTTQVWQIFLREHNLPLSWYAFLDGMLMLWVLLSPVFMYLAFLQMKMTRWMWAAVGIASGLAFAQVPGGDYNWMSPSLRLSLSMPLLLIAHVGIPILLLVHARRGRREAGILLIPALLQAVVADFEGAMGVLGWIPALSTRAFDFKQQMTLYAFGPFTIQLTNIANWLFWISLGLILVLRTVRISRDQAKMEDELEAARQVQNVILPDKAVTIPGFSVDTVYRPARQVGGDFYQVWAAADGGMLLVLGDVAGKGLPAAMLVAVLVGSIRTMAQITSDPAVILDEMNTRLLGRSNGGFSTCLALHLRADGSGTLASAGHLPPYLNGRELKVPSSLPLGIVPCQLYESCEVQLEHGGHLTLYSDGVVEAQNARRELLGFDRMGELSMLNATEIADAASAFGQEDDITVVVIERSPSLAGVAESTSLTHNLESAGFLDQSAIST